MRVPDLLTASERRLAALLFLLSMIGTLGKCGRGISPEIEAWLDGAPVTRAVGDSAQSVGVAEASARPPARGDAVKPPEADAPSPAVLVDPNHADAEALMALPGIGPALAARIVQEREVNGPFATAADLMRVRGIGPATLARLRPHISLP